VYDKTWMKHKYDAVIAHHIEHTIKGIIYLSHWHHLMEIITVSQGEMILRVRDEVYELKSGDIILINPNEVHTAESKTDLLIYDCFQIDLFLLSDELSDIQQKFIRNKFITERCFIKANLKRTNAKAFIDRMVGIGEERESLERITRQLMIYLARSQRQFLEDEDVKDLIHYKHTLSQIKSTVGLMQEQYRQKITLEDLAKMANLSTIHYARLFKRVMHYTPIEYLNYIRIQNAISLLVNTQLSVAEIAMQTGLNDSNYFSRFFKHYRAMTPTAFRKKYGYTR
jgi:AraC-like DNA-binding protein